MELAKRFVFFQHLRRKAANRNMFDPGNLRGNADQVVIRDSERRAILEVCFPDFPLPDTGSPPAALFASLFTFESETLCFPDVEEQFANHVSRRCVGMSETLAEPV